MNEVRPLGRVLRLLFGIAAVSLTLPVYLTASATFILTSLGIVIVLTGIYSLLHYGVSNFAPDLDRWLGAMIALIPVLLMVIFGQVDGLIFGNGEGAIGALTYLGISYFVDYIRADSGCEVMAIPGVLFRNRTHLACVVLTPIDILEEKLSSG